MGDYMMMSDEQDREKVRAVLIEILPDMLDQYLKQEQAGLKTQNAENKPEQTICDQARDIDLIERVVKVEEGILHIHELIKEQMRLLEKRFEQIDKRFEQVDKRFEQVDKRFAMLQWFIGLGFAGISVLMGVFNYL